MIVYRGEYVVL